MFNLYQVQNQIRDQIHLSHNLATERAWIAKKESKSKIEQYYSYNYYDLLVKQEQMVSNYKKRLIKFINQMKQQPLDLEDDREHIKRNIINNSRPQEDIQKMKGNCFFRINYPSYIEEKNKDYSQGSKENRVRSISQNQVSTMSSIPSNCDSTYCPYVFHKEYEFRSRERKKEICGNMKFGKLFLSHNNSPEQKQEKQNDGIIIKKKSNWRPGSYAIVRTKPKQSFGENSSRQATFRKEEGDEEQQKDENNCLTQDLVNLISDQEVNLINRINKEEEQQNDNSKLKEYVLADTKNIMNPTISKQRNRIFKQENQVTPISQTIQINSQSLNHSEHEDKLNTMKHYFKASIEIAMKSPLLKQSPVYEYEETYKGTFNIKENPNFDINHQKDALQILNECKVFRPRKLNSISYRRSSQSRQQSLITPSS